MAPPQGSKVFTLKYIGKLKKNLLLRNHKADSFHIWYMATSRGPLQKLLKESLWGQKWPSPRGQKLLHLNIYRDTLKNLLLWNHKAESFHIWYMATSRGPFDALLKESPWGKKWPHPRGQKIFFSKTIRRNAFIGIWQCLGVQKLQYFLFTYVW